MQNLFKILKKNKFPALITCGVFIGSIAAWRIYNYYFKDNAENPPNPFPPLPDQPPMVPDIELTD